METDLLGAETVEKLQALYQFQECGDGQRVAEIAKIESDEEC